MTAFLFIPAARGSVTRRVDFANYASLFADDEETVATNRRGVRVARALAMLLVLGLAIGDTVLIARPDAMAHAPAAAPVTSL